MDIVFHYSLSNKLASLFWQKKNFIRWTVFVIWWCLLSFVVYSVKPLKVLVCTNLKANWSTSIDAFPSPKCSLSFFISFFFSQTCRLLLSQKSEGVESSKESLLAEDSLMPATDTTTDSAEKDSHSSSIGLDTNQDSMQPVITLTRLKMQTDDQQQEKEAEPSSTSEDLSTTSRNTIGSTDQDLSLYSKEETTSQESVVQEILAELPADSREKPDSEPAAAVEDANEEDEEKEAPAVPGKKNGTGRARATPKRRSGRATNRRWVEDEVERHETWYNLRTGCVSLWRGAVMKWRPRSEQPSLTPCWKVVNTHQQKRLLMNWGATEFLVSCSPRVGN